MADVKITKKMVLNSLVNAFAEEVVVANIDGVEITGADVKAFAENEISLIDKKAEKSKAKAAEKKADGDELQAAVLAALTDEFQSAGDITAKIEDDDVSVSKVIYRLTQLAKNGQAEKSDATVDDEGKKRTIKVYKLA